MEAISERQLRDVLTKRSDSIKQHIDTLTSKQVRRDLEKELALPVKGLDGYKALIDDLINEVILGLPVSQGDAEVQVSQGVSGKTPQKPSKPAASLEENKAKAKPKVVESKPKQHKDREEEEEEEPRKKSKKKKAPVDEEEEEEPAPKKSKKKKPVIEEEEEEEEEEEAPRKSKKGGKHKRKAAEVEEEEEEEGSSEEEGGRAAKRKAKAKPAAAGPRKYGPEVEKLKALCKLATITVGPNVYKGGDESTVIENLKALLAKHDLHARSDQKAVLKVAAKLKLSRDLDGIECKNIINLDGGRPRRGAAAAAVRGVQQHLKALAESDDDKDNDSDGEGDAPFPPRGTRRPTAKAAAEASPAASPAEAAMAQQPGPARKKTVVSGGRFSHSVPAGVGSQQGGEQLEDEEDVVMIEDEEEGKEQGGQPAERRRVAVLDDDDDDASQDEDRGDTAKGGTAKGSGAKKVAKSPKKPAKQESSEEEEEDKEEEEEEGSGDDSDDEDFQVDSDEED